ncbi:hypothetical protein ACO0R3_002180 [Hanseniaspora guilliermondii]
MSLAQKLLKIDAFTKTKDDVRIRTRSGGLITIMLLLTSLILIINEWKMFNTIQIIPSLVVDRDRNKRMNMFLDIDFLNMPCDYLYLDMMDESGEIQLDITGTENCQKTQLSDGSCNVKGNVYLNRLQGHFHFAPGKPYQNPITGQHSHDIQEYGNKNFDHKINKISFDYDEDLTSNNDNKLIQSFFEESINQVISEPLTGTEVLDGDSYKQYSYFLKIVPTRFEDLTKRPHPNRHKSELLLDGTSHDSKIKKVEKIQYTATTHSKPINGGRDEDHPNTLHQRGGIPGMFFVFDISSLKIINKLQYRMNWYGFILNLLSSLGGIFALYTVLDKVAYKTINYYRLKKDQ